MTTDNRQENDDTDRVQIPQPETEGFLAREESSQSLRHRLMRRWQGREKDMLTPNERMHKRRHSAWIWRAAIFSFAAVLVALILGTALVLYGMTQTVDLQLTVDGQAVDRLVQDYIANRGK